MTVIIKHKYAGSTSWRCCFHNTVIHYWSVEKFNSQGSLFWTIFAGNWRLIAYVLDYTNIRYIHLVAKRSVIGNEGEAGYIVGDCLLHSWSLISTPLHSWRKRLHLLKSVLKQIKRRENLRSGNGYQPSIIYFQSSNMTVLDQLRPRRAV